MFVNIKQMCYNNCFVQLSFIWIRFYLKRKNKIKIMGEDTKLYCFACRPKTGNWTVKSTTECTKTHHTETQNQKFFCGGEGAVPFPNGEGEMSHPLPTPHPLRRLNPPRAYGARPRSAPRLLLTGLCSSKLTLKKPCALQTTENGCYSII